MALHSYELGNLPVIYRISCSVNDDWLRNRNVRTIFVLYINLNLTIVTSEQWRDKNTGEQKELTEWHRVAVSGKLAEVVGQYVKKGDQIYFEGMLRTRKWKDQSGQDRYTTEVHVGINGVMQMLGGIGDSKQQAASRQSQKPQQQSSPAQHNEPPMDFDDDIPFAPVTLPFPRHAIHAI